VCITIKAYPNYSRILRENGLLSARIFHIKVFHTTILGKQEISQNYLVDNAQYSRIALANGNVAIVFIALETSW
jgi:hypothetical protein